MFKADAELLAAAPCLRAICYAARSVKYFVTPASYARGVRITTAMHANVVPVAEVTIALISELQTGRITAHLDVTHREPPVPGSSLYSLPNVWLTPHLAGSSSSEIRRMGRLAVEECLESIASRPPRFPVSEAMLATMA